MERLFYFWSFPSFWILLLSGVELFQQSVIGLNYLVIVFGCFRCIPKTGNILGFWIFLCEVSQSTEKKLSILFLKWSFLKVDSSIFLGFSAFGVLKALLSDLKSFLAFVGVYLLWLLNSFVCLRLKIKLSNPDIPIHLKAGFLVTSSCVFLINPKD